MRLGYASEAESRIDQDEEKPKWMRWRTFDRICAQLDATDRAWGLMVLARFGSLITPHLEG